MPSSQTPLKSDVFDEIALWIVIGLFLALAIAWTAYPRIYLLYHPQPPWPGGPQGWGENSGFSTAQVYFFFAGMTAALGYGQLRFRGWFGRDSSKILLRFFLLSGMVFLAGSWTFALANRFWTVEDNRVSLLGAQHGMEIGRTLVKLGVWSYLAAAFLNLGYALIPKRRA